VNTSNQLLKESGLVTHIEGNFAWVNTANKLSCSSCQVESTCGNGMLEKYLAGKVFVSKIKNDLNAQIGDRVEIAIPVASVTRASLIAYTVPLMALIFGALLGQYLFNSEGRTIVMSVLGLFAGLIITHFYNQKIANSERYMPKMVSRTSTDYRAQVFDSIKVKNI